MLAMSFSVVSFPPEIKRKQKPRISLSAKRRPPVELGCDEARDEILRGALTFFLDELAEAAEQIDRGLIGRRRRLRHTILAMHQRLGPDSEIIVIIRRRA